MTKGPRFWCHHYFQTINYQIFGFNINFRSLCSELMCASIQSWNNIFDALKIDLGCPIDQTSAPSEWTTYNNKLCMTRSEDSCGIFSPYFPGNRKFFCRFTESLLSTAELFAKVKFNLENNLCGRAVFAIYWMNWFCQLCSYKKRTLNINILFGMFHNSPFTFITFFIKDERMFQSAFTSLRVVLVFVCMTWKIGIE